jgi:pimeloyl-ACP methyl ester carboxylesterase
MRIIRMAVFVQHATWLFFSARVVDNALESRQFQDGSPGDEGVILEQVHRHAQRIAAKQAVEQAVGARRSDQWSCRAERIEALDATKLTQDACERLDVHPLFLNCHFRRVRRDRLYATKTVCDDNLFSAGYAASSVRYEELFAAAVEEARRQDIPIWDTAPPLNQSCAADRLRLHYLDWGGDGKPPLVLLHGALTHAHVWDFFSLQLREHFHIYSVDLPGHGDSEWAADGDYSRARMTAEIAGLLQTAGWDSVSLVGHSLGGSIAALVAATLPWRVRSLVMVDSTLLPTGRPSVLARLTGGPDRFPSLEAFAHHAARFNPRRDPARLAVSLRWNARQLEDGSWSWKYDPGLRHGGSPPEHERVWSALAGLRVPVLFVRAGEHSHLTEEAAERLHALPNVQTVVVPRAAHNVMGDNPLEFNARVNDFLRVVRGELSAHF